jgi:hypothetical protein
MAIEVCPPNHGPGGGNGTCWAVPPSRGPMDPRASANGGATIRIEDSDIFANAAWIVMGNTAILAENDSHI